MPLELSSELLNYLARNAKTPGTRIPAIQELAVELDISTGKLREQLEVARQLGMVEVKPKTGIRTLEFSFSEALKASLLFALAVDEEYFYQFGMLRNHIEASFWYEAVGLLHPVDKKKLEVLIQEAWAKLHGEPIQIPHQEHRELHLTIYSRLENPFVVGLLEAYWDAYEAVGLNLYTDYAYLREVWTYHRQMVDAILEDDEDAGYQALVAHTGLLQNRPEIGRFRPAGALESIVTDV
ncbi:MAG: FCD domain-containing protein [Anaerolineales bacterium]|nr:FCD domain-containing protein [Anaerolineales bacterium]